MSSDSAVMLAVDMGPGGPVKDLAHIVARANEAVLAEMHKIPLTDEARRNIEGGVCEHSAFRRGCGECITASLRTTDGSPPSPR